MAPSKISKSLGLTLRSTRIHLHCLPLSRIFSLSRLAGDFAARHARHASLLQYSLKVFRNTDKIQTPALTVPVFQVPCPEYVFSFATT